jgi:hypothetical protein
MCGSGRDPAQFSGRTPSDRACDKRHGARWEGFIKVDTRQDAGRFEPCSVHQ